MQIMKGSIRYKNKQTCRKTNKDNNNQNTNEPKIVFVWRSSISSCFVSAWFVGHYIVPNFYQHIENMVLYNHCF